MTYFGFLLRFLIPPIVVLALIAAWDARRGRRLPTDLGLLNPWLVLAIHAAVAVIWTTPWDNYLVATRVWWYDPALVSGVILGWVPLEEYIFFVLETVLAGLWLLVLAVRMAPPARPFDPAARAARRARWGGTALAAALLLLGAGLLAAGYRPATYLALTLVWIAPPLLLQAAFGGDILWQHRKLALATLLPAWLYLCAADFVAIGLGTWIIAPGQSVGIAAGHLPLEEIVFFFATNAVLTGGMVLMLARESGPRAPRFLRARIGAASPSGKGAGDLSSPAMVCTLPGRDSERLG